MPLYKPSELREFLQSIGADPSRALSQNFLIDGNIIRKTVTLAEVKAGDSVLEIGPGPGALTEALLETGANVIAVEKDKRLATALERLQNGRLRVINDDILTVNLEEILPKGTKVVANLPYSLTSPILGRLLPSHHLIETVVVMVQKEVAKRLCAKAGTKDFSSLTLFVNFHSKIKSSFDVGRRCFYPAPKVDSAVVRMDLNSPPALSDTDRFWKLIKTSFNQRRKMMRASLKELYPAKTVEGALIDIKTAPTSRPEQLSLDKFIALFEKLESLLN